MKTSPIPDPTADPFSYLRLISRDLRAMGNTTCANEVLDAIVALRAERDESVTAVKASYDILNQHAVGPAKPQEYALALARGILAKGETPAQETKRLQRVIDFANERIADLRNAALTENMMAGLKLIGLNGGKVLVSHFHETCLSGGLYLGVADERSPYDAGEACGLEQSNHASESVQIDDTYVSLSQDDGNLRFQISITVKLRDPKPLLVDSLKRFRAFLDGVGIAIDASEFVYQRKRLIEQVAEKSALISSLNGDDAPAVKA